MKIKIFVLSLLCAAALSGCGGSKSSNDSSLSSTEISSVEAVTELDSNFVDSSSNVVDSNVDNVVTKFDSSNVNTSSLVVELLNTDSSFDNLESNYEEIKLDSEPSKSNAPASDVGENQIIIEYEIVETPIESDFSNQVIIESEPDDTQAQYEENPNTGIDSYSYQLLAEIVWHEAGSDWVSLYDKAHIAAAVMNRVYDSRFPDSVYSVLTQSGQFSGYWPGCCYPTQACYDAVDYYLANSYSFDESNSWWVIVIKIIFIISKQ